MASHLCKSHKWPTQPCLFRNGPNQERWELATFMVLPGHPMDWIVFFCIWLMSPEICLYPVSVLFSGNFHIIIIPGQCSLADCSIQLSEFYGYQYHINLPWHISICFRLNLNEKCCITKVQLRNERPSDLWKAVNELQWISKLVQSTLLVDYILATRSRFIFM